MAKKASCLFTGILKLSILQINLQQRSLILNLPWIEFGGTNRATTKKAAGTVTEFLDEHHAADADLRHDDQPEAKRARLDRAASPRPLTLVSSVAVQPPGAVVPALPTRHFTQPTRRPLIDQLHKDIVERKQRVRKLRQCMYDYGQIQPGDIAWLSGRGTAR